MNFLNVIPLLHNGIFNYNLNCNSQNIKKYISDIEYVETNTEETELSYISKNKSILNNLPELKNEIELACNHFINNTLQFNADYFIYNSWSTKTFPCGYSKSHTHSNSWISGVYYPEYNKDFKIKFYNDFTNSFYTKPNSYNIFNSKQWEICPKENQLIFFFSNLRHKVIYNKSSINRHSISFNILPNKIFGDADSKVNFKF